MTASKACNRCGEVKPFDLENFPPAHQVKSGLAGHCRPCQRAISRASKAKHRDVYLSRRREQYARDNGERHRETEQARFERAPYRVSAQNLRNGIWERSKDRHLAVDAELRTTAFIEVWLRRQPDCPCCGVAFRLGRKGTGHFNDCSPSFDRFDPADGYTLKNTVLICWRCNNIKRNYSEQDLLTVAAWMTRHRSSLRHEATKFDEVQIA